MIRAVVRSARPTPRQVMGGGISPKLIRVGYRRLRAPIPPWSTVPRSVLNQYALNGYEPLGFSLKPPRWLRKAQPGKILKKVAIPAAIVGAMFIPGVAPLALKAGGMLLKGGVGVVKAGGGLVRGAGGLVRGAATGGAKAVTGLFGKRTIAALQAPPTMGTPGFEYPQAPAPAPAQTPTFVPAEYQTSYPMAPQMMQASAGGGVEMPMMETGPGPEAGAKVLGPGLVVVGGLVALGLIASMSSRRRG
jgi:hypothetical protein